jgi:beta-lactamase class A
MPENLRPSEPLLPVSRRTTLQIGTLTACGLGVLEPPGVCAAERNSGLQRRFDELEKRYEGEFSIEVTRLDAEGHFALRPDVVRQTASTFKLFVLCEPFRQAEEGTIDLEAPITWKPEFHRRDDGFLRAMVPGQKLSIHNIVG